MRPRGIPRGKRALASIIIVRSAARFNEAAGNTPRKTRPVTHGGRTRGCFNEAAGNTPRKTGLGDSDPLVLIRLQ